MRIKKIDVLERWEMIYAQAAIELEEKGLFVRESIANSKGGLGTKIHPGFNILKDATRILGDFNRWHEGSDQLELEL